MVFKVSPHFEYYFFFFGKFFFESCPMYDQTQCSLLNGEPPLLAHLYKWEGEDFGQNTWVSNQGLLGIPFGNALKIWKTRLEHIGKFLGTWWEHMGTPKKWKISPPHPSPPTPNNQKKVGGLWMCVAPSHLLHAISIFKTINHHFWPRLTTRLEFWAHNVIHINYSGLLPKSNLFFTTSKIWCKKTCKVKHPC
jgi:hypothetical protein